MKKFLAVSALALTLGMATSAEAYFTLTGGTGVTLGSVPGATKDYDPNGNAPGEGVQFIGLAGFTGATLTWVGDGLPVLVTFFGKEAGFIDTQTTFQGFGVNIANTAASGSNATVGPVAAGAIPVVFTADDLDNGVGVDFTYTSPSDHIFFGCLTGTNANCTEVVISLDNGGNSNNLDYDDWVGTAKVVPIPAALPLLGTAVAGLGLAAWRKRRAA